MAKEVADLKNKEHLTWPSYKKTLGLADDVTPMSSSHFGIPVDDEMVIVQCASCSRPVVQSGFSKHLEICKGAESVDNGNAVDPSTPRIVAPSDIASQKPIQNVISQQPAVTKKKRKLAVDKEDASKKRLPGSINTEVHCAVITETGAPCSRSITCKIHTVTAKRAVVRAVSFDVLYQEHQHKSMLARGRKELKPSASKLKSSASAATRSGTTANIAAAAGKHDQEEEIALVIAALTRIKAKQPSFLSNALYTKPFDSSYLWLERERRSKLLKVFGDN